MVGDVWDDSAPSCKRHGSSCDGVPESGACTAAVCGKCTQSYMQRNGSVHFGGLVHVCPMRNQEASNLELAVRCREEERRNPCARVRGREGACQCMQATEGAGVPVHGITETHDPNAPKGMVGDTGARHITVPSPILLEKSARISIEGCFLPEAPLAARRNWPEDTCFGV